jgi:hypothetical protein
MIDLDYAVNGNLGCDLLSDVLILFIDFELVEELNVVDRLLAKLVTMFVAHECHGASHSGCVSVVCFLGVLLSDEFDYLGVR